MKQSQSARRQPLFIMITTAGIIRECIFDDMYSYACKVANETFIDEALLPIIYELDSKDEWTNPKDSSGILAKDFNIRDTINTAWLSFDDINNEKTFDLSEFKNCYTIGGVDLSITMDLTCATLLMMNKDTEECFLTQMYWLPRDNFEK